MSAYNLLPFFSIIPWVLLHPVCHSASWTVCIPVVRRLPPVLLPQDSHLQHCLLIASLKTGSLLNHIKLFLLNILHYSSFYIPNSLYSWIIFLSMYSTSLKLWAVSILWSTNCKKKVCDHKFLYSSTYISPFLMQELLPYNF